MSLPQGLGSLEQTFIQPSPSLPHANPQPSPAASANQAQPQQPSQRHIPTPQQNFVSSATPQSNLTQISSHVSADGLPSNGALGQINSAPAQQSPRITHPPSQQPIEPIKLPPLLEDRFKINFMQFTRAKGIRLNERDLVVEGRPINLWALHRIVFMRNGFDSVSTRDEWPVIGAALGFPQVATGDASRPPRCAPAIANRLQQLYNDVLRHFDQVYISSIIARLRISQSSLPQPPQPQVQPHQPTEADYQALLGSITSESSVLKNPEAMIIIPRFSHTSGAELEAHHVPPNVIAFVEQNREQLQRGWQDQNLIRAVNGRTLWSSQAPPPQPPQPQVQPHQPTEADYQALLGSVTSESSVMKNSEAMIVLPRFSHTSGADLEAHRVPPNVIASVEQNREHLQRAAQDQNGFRAGLTSTKNAPPDNCAQVDHGSALLPMARLPQFMPGQQQMQQLQSQCPVQGPGKPSPLQPAQLFNNVGSLVPPSTAQSIGASSIPPISTQIIGSNSGGGVQNQGGSMSVEQNREHLQRAAQDQNGPRKPNVPQPQARAHQPTEADYQAINTLESSIMNTEATGILPSTVTPPEKLHPTLSCWIKNMNKLSSLIDRLQELASSAPAEYRSQLLRQVVALRTTSKKQQEHCIEFLTLSEEYANKYLLDISAEVQQQSSFLDKLEERLEAATKLHSEAVDLRMFYESGTVANMKNLRDTVISRPLPEDRDLFRQVDLVLTEIRQCYTELDKFWTEEISRATEALRMRSVDPADFERWVNFHANLKQTIESWKKEPPGDDQTLHHNEACSSKGADIGAIASSLSSAMGLLTSVVDHLPSCNSVKYSRLGQSSVQQVYVAFAANRDLCFSFLQRCADYREKVIGCRYPSITLPTSHCASAPHDLRERITRLSSKMTSVSVENVGSVQGSRKFKAAYKKALSLEQEMAFGLNTLLEVLSSWVMVTAGHGLSGDAIPDIIALERLHKLWEKARFSICAALAILKNEPVPQSFFRSAPLASTRPQSVMKRMKRWMMNIVCLS